MPEIWQKVYDPDKNKLYTKAKEDSCRKTGFVDAGRSSSFSSFPSDDSAFDKDFSVLPVFVPTDTLDHLKECGKTTKKSTAGDAVTSSTKGLKGHCHANFAIFRSKPLKYLTKSLFLT